MEYFKNLDLNWAAKNQCGDGFIAKQYSDHLYGWGAYKPGLQIQSIDMQLAVQRYYGPEYHSVFTGVHAYDWKAYAPMLWSYKVVPVLQISADLFSQIDLVKIAVNNFSSLINSVRDFYYQQVGETFDVLPVLCQESKVTNKQWFDVAQKSLDPAYREVYGDLSMQILKDRFKVINPKLIYIVTQFCGFDNLPDKISPFGAINKGNISVIPATACLEQRTTNDPNDYLSLFACSHELGHASGLPHTDTIPAYQRPSNWENSIMQGGWGWKMPPILLESEKAFLRNSPFFK